MNEHTEEFKCKCGSKQFSKSYSFSIDFRNVNFTYDVIYDIIKTEMFTCFECGREYTKEMIGQSLCDMIDKYKEDYWEDKGD